MKEFEVTDARNIFGSEFDLSHFQILLFKWFINLFHYAIWIWDAMATCWSYTFLIKRKTFAKYRWCTQVGGKVALIPIVNSKWYDLLSMVSIPAKNTTDIYMAYNTTYPPSGARALNTAWTTLHYENVFLSWGRDHKTSLGPHTLGARSWLVARQTHNPYCMIGTVLKQTSSWGDGSGIHITQREDTYLLTML
jgi:hypothetical protein